MAIVTGAGAEGDDVGIGRSIALLMAAEGARLVCADLDPARAQTTVERIKADGGCAVAAGGDVGDPDVCGKLVDAAVAAFGRLDILV
uniref:SDR family oxidoreductase n=1 Tax=Sphingobium fuliginis (strain ATCC 27551) TaxID=336203 RepID=UPI0020C7F978